MKYQSPAVTRHTSTSLPNNAMQGTAAWQIGIAAAHDACSGLILKAVARILTRAGHPICVTVQCAPFSIRCRQSFYSVPTGLSFVVRTPADCALPAGNCQPSLDIDRTFCGRRICRMGSDMALSMAILRTSLAIYRHRACDSTCAQNSGDRHL